VGDAKTKARVAPINDISPPEACEEDRRLEMVTSGLFLKMLVIQRAGIFQLKIGAAVIRIRRFRMPHLQV
jgi:hypothetical protein